MAIQMDPKLAMAYYGLACIAAKKRQVGEAIKYLRQAIQIETKWREKAKTDKDFDFIRTEPLFLETLK